jgi:hypothetical protein
MSSTACNLKEKQTDSQSVFWLKFVNKKFHKTIGRLSRQPTVQNQRSLSEKHQWQKPRYYSHRYS